MTREMARTGGESTLVVGLGKTGLSCVRYLRAQGHSVAVTDSRANPPGLERLREEMPDIAQFLGGFDESIFAVADRLVVSPGVPVTNPHVAAAAARGAEVLGDIELFARAAHAPIAAITGSNGKSTATTLLGRMAEQCGVRVAVGGNLGKPALELLDDAVDLYVLELSSFQLETTRSLHSRAAAVLNLSSDHMDRYPDMSAYAAAKARILDGAEVAVLNRDDPLVMEMRGIAGADRSFGLDRPVQDRDFGMLTKGHERWLARGSDALMAVEAVALVGRHNLANALAALAMGDACGLRMEPMLDVLHEFQGLPHRTMLVAEKGGVRWYDDSKGTNPGATAAALEGLVDHRSQARVVLIAGGECKGADFAPLADVIERTARAVVLIGRDAPMIERVLAGRVGLFQAVDMDDAVRHATEVARAGDSVLLSPACASFDMFENYEHRGRVFAAAVQELPA